MRPGRNFGHYAAKTTVQIDLRGYDIGKDTQLIVEDRNGRLVT